MIINHNIAFPEGIETDGVQVYLVGGAVRDLLMGLEPKDLDWVVVGANPAYMLNRGYKEVGNDFPVFLDDHGTEFALARLERQTGTKYQDFETTTNGVSLEEDLSRRDLTMNAIAMDRDGNIIDPFGGHLDIQDKILKHTSEAFREDPIRILRVFRFAARYNFRIHHLTHDVMMDMILKGMLRNVPQERILKEFEKGMNEELFFIMFSLADAYGNATEAAPILQNNRYVTQLKWVLRTGAGKKANFPYHVRAAHVLQGYSKDELAAMTVSSHISQLASLASKMSKFHIFDTLYPETKLELLTQAGALNNTHETYWQDFEYLFKLHVYFSIGSVTDNYLNEYFGHVTTAVQALKDIDYETALKGVPNKDKAVVVRQLKLEALKDHFE